MTTTLVTFNGREVMKGWPEKVQAAQLAATYNICGKDQPRIPYDGDKPCHDCAVMPGQLHVPGCDTERCPACRGQAISCECDD